MAKPEYSMSSCV